MFYTDFSEDYNEIFPFSREVYSLLRSFIPRGKDSPEAVSPAPRILDIGCGTGELCIRFAEEGYRCTGVDLDPGMIAAAKAARSGTIGGQPPKTAEPAIEIAAPAIDFRLMNMMEIGKLSPGYDLIYSTGNVMAHIDKTAFGELLPVIKSLLLPGGRWFFQVINWDYILGQDEFVFPVLKSGTKDFHRSYTEISARSLSFNTRLVNRDDGVSVFSDTVNLFPIRSAEYREMHKEAGLELTAQYGSYGKDPFDRETFSSDIYIFTREE